MFPLDDHLDKFSNQGFASTEYWAGVVQGRNSADLQANWRNCNVQGTQSYRSQSFLLIINSMGEMSQA